MGYSKKTGKGRLDKYYFLAKEQGYRARSAFKLIQLNKRFHIFDQARVVIDLCAAPGGWLQVAAKYMPVSNIIIGVDLVPIKPISGVKTVVADITTEACRAELKKELKTWKADVILHDGAPNVGRAWIHDAYGQAELVLLSLKVVTNFLIAGGTFVTKVFRSKDYNSLLWVFKQLFNKVEATKPSSSRDVSAEIFVVCQGYKCPEVIDPKLLDPRYAFEDLTLNDKNKKLALAHPGKATRQRGGYDDSSILLHKKISIDEFIALEDSTDVLAKYNEITILPDSSQEIIKHMDSYPELRESLKDLKVLGLKEIKRICKWHSKVRKLIGLDKSTTHSQKQSEASVAEKDDTISAQDEADATLLKVNKLSKKALKSRVQRKAKELLRLRQKKMDSSWGIIEDNSLLNEFSSGVLENGNDANFREEAMGDALDIDDSLSDTLSTDRTSDKEDKNEQMLTEKQKAWFSDPIFDALSKVRHAKTIQNPSNEEKKEHSDSEEESTTSEKQNTKDNSKDLNILGTASGMALAKRLCRASDNEDMVDDSFNRYAFDDAGQLPEWFADDEKHHNKPTMPITKEDVSLLRQKLREMETRPTKKILEARGRNKKRALQRFERMKKAADNIVGSEELGERQKGEQIQKLLRKARSVKRKPTQLVIAKGKNRGVKGRPKGVKGRYKMVDRRMKKELRAKKRVESR